MRPLSLASLGLSFATEHFYLISQRHFQLSDVQIKLIILLLKTGPVPAFPPGGLSQL